MLTSGSGCSSSVHPPPAASEDTFVPPPPARVFVIAPAGFPTPPSVRPCVSILHTQEGIRRKEARGKIKAKTKQQRK